MRNYDLDFLKHFSMLLGFLAVLTVAMILFAHYLQSTLPYEADPGVAVRTQARIAPVGAVYAGATGAAAQAEAAAAAAAAAAAQVAYGGTLDGEVIYNKLCTACHTAGVGGAPTLDPAHWTSRITQGIETLYTHAIDGYTGATGIMPPKGGNPALTDEQVKATVDWMVAQTR